MCAWTGLAGVLHDMGREKGAQERFQQRGKSLPAHRPPRSTRFRWPSTPRAFLRHRGAERQFASTAIMTRASALTRAWYPGGQNAPLGRDLAHHRAVVRATAPLHRANLFPALAWPAPLLERLTSEGDTPRLHVPPRYQAGYLLLEAFDERSAISSLFWKG